MSVAPKRGSRPLRPIYRPRLYEQLVERLLDHMQAEGLTARRPAAPGSGSSRPSSG